jgi:hypothetical protein
LLKPTVSEPGPFGPDPKNSGVPFPKNPGSRAKDYFLSRISRLKDAELPAILAKQLAYWSAIPAGKSKWGIGLRDSPIDHRLSMLEEIIGTPL